MDRICCCLFCCKNKKRVTGTRIEPFKIYENDSNYRSSNKVDAISPNTQSNNVYTALYDYSHQTQFYDFSFKKGDHFILLNSVISGWWLVRSQVTEHEGYVPSNYLVKYVSFEDKRWYFGKITMNQCMNLLLRNDVKNGTFLVRDSTTLDNFYSLSVKWQNAVNHYRIYTTNDRDFYIDEKINFPTIQKLVEYYHRQPINSEIILQYSSNQLKGPDTESTTFIDNLRNYEVDRNSIQFVKKIGSGNYGEVWSGLLNGLAVAIKTLKHDAMEIKDFIEEAEILAKLFHERLVRLYGVCTKEQPIYIITEFVKYESLSKYLQEHRQNITVKDLEQMASQIAEGMAYLESQHYVHRDLAARNVLVGENLRIKICDFGLARVVRDDDSASNKRSKVPVRWTAPEALINGQYSVKSDVWSYGILLYEMFTYGQTPYQDIRTNSEVLEKIQQGYRLPKPEGCPDFVYDIMTQCWSATPEDRPDFKKIVDDFERM